MTPTQDRQSGSNNFYDVVVMNLVRHAVQTYTPLPINPLSRAMSLPYRLSLMRHYRGGRARIYFTYIGMWSCIRTSVGAEAAPREGMWWELIVSFATLADAQDVVMHMPSC
eukprot:GHVU01077966.1.p2 GENE.GHVU01077966.1~~GHVU01077966.1.p2  ORF type:complete len:111 (-),score=4.65 GHVU01077966.1:816-1148(-)